MQTFAAKFQSYAHDNGDWPAASASPGDYPSGMESQLKATRWRVRTPIGGRFAWLADTLQRGERIRAAIAVTSVAGDPVSDDRRQLEALLREAKMAGIQAVRLGFRNEPIYVLEH